MAVGADGAVLGVGNPMGSIFQFTTALDLTVDGQQDAADSAATLEKSVAPPFEINISQASGQQQKTR